VVLVIVSIILFDTRITMNSKKNSLLILVVFLLGCTLPISMAAMLSKPQHTKEEKEYTQQDLARQKVLAPKLLSACLNGQLKVVRALIEAGADVNSIYARDERGDTPLHIASYMGFLDIVKLLVANDADMEAKDFDKITPLYVACASHMTNVMEYLIKNGANINAVSKGGGSVLSMACYKDYVDVVTLLLKNGADITIKDYKGRTALHSACKCKSAQIVRMLIEKGTNIEAKTDYGFTPLYFACFYKNYDIAKALLKAGADYDADAYGTTPVDFVCDAGYSNIIALFNEYGAFTKKQEEANQAMHEFFKELNKEHQQKIKKSVGQQQKKQVKVVESKKEKILSKKQIEELKQRESSAGEISSEQLSEVQPVEQVLVTSSVTPSSTSTTSTITTTPMISTSPSIESKSEISKKSPSQVSVSQGNVYLVVEGKQLKWPRSLKPKQEKLIEDNISALKNWPDHGLSDVKKMEKQPNTFRLRVGGYRIIFSVDNARREIKIEHIGLRKNIYKQI
jgi:ankyrin repeat protein/mRNA-degrading endonuclease RelE of RelBE toxin-antitoxin system